MAAQIMTQRLREEHDAAVHLTTARVYPHLELVRLHGYRDDHQNLPTSASLSVNIQDRERGGTHGRCHVVGRSEGNETHSCSQSICDPTELSP